MVTTFAVFGGFFYLLIGAFFACGADSVNAPKWISIPLLVLLWPLAIVFVIWAVLAWIARGSH